MLVALPLSLRCAFKRGEAASTVPTPLRRTESQWGSITWASHATQMHMWHPVQAHSSAASLGGSGSPWTRFKLGWSCPRTTP